MRAAAGGLLAMLALSPAGAKPTAPPHEYGPPPDWQRFTELAEAAIRTDLRDPDSAKFRWERGYAKGGWGLWSKGRTAGYAACGYVNARNSYGGYVGDTAFVVVIDNDRVLGFDVDREPHGLIERGCDRAISQASFPPVPDERDDATVEAVAHAPASALPASIFGLHLTAVPDGAYVASVVPGGVTDKAGIKPGMVIDHLNGIAIRGMALPLVEQLLDATADRASLTMIGGATFTVKRPLPAAPSTLAEQRR